jgi:hypothetical protein
MMKTKMNEYLKYKVTKTAVVITMVLVFLSACKKHEDSSAPADCAGPAKSFANDVNPIVQVSCATNSGCHGSGSNNGPGELIGYSKIFNASSDIRSQVSSGRMPLTGSLTTAQKNAIICWIDNGAPNN